MIPGGAEEGRLYSISVTVDSPAAPVWGENGIKHICIGWQSQTFVLVGHARHLPYQWFKGSRQEAWDIII